MSASFIFKGQSASLNSFSPYQSSILLCPAFISVHLGFGVILTQFSLRLNRMKIWLTKKNRPKKEEDDKSPNTEGILIWTPPWANATKFELWGVSHCVINTALTPTEGTSSYFLHTTHSHTVRNSPCSTLIVTVIKFMFFIHFCSRQQWTVSGHTNDT